MVRAILSLRECHSSIFWPCGARSGAAAAGVGYALSMVGDGYPPLLSLTQPVVRFDPPTIISSFPSRRLLRRWLFGCRR
jgi:hypothetical protein